MGGYSEDLNQWKVSFRNSHQSGGGGYSEDLNQWKFSFRNSHQSGDGIHQTLCQPGGQWQLFGLPRGKSFGKQVKFKKYSNVTNDILSERKSTTSQNIYFRFGNIYMIWYVFHDMVAFLWYNWKDMRESCNIRIKIQKSQRLSVFRIFFKKENIRLK